MSMSYENFSDPLDDSHETHDVVLVADLIDTIIPHIATHDFLPTETNAFGAVSTLVCHYEGIGGKRRLYEQQRSFLDDQRAQGKLRPDLLAMDSATFKQFADSMTDEFSTRLADQAVEPLQDYLRDIKRVCGTEALGKAVMLGEVMGVRLTDERPKSIARDEERAAKLVELAKRMDSGYGVFYVAETTGSNDPGLVEFLLRLNREE